MRVAIIGAGPTGLSSAVHLLKNDRNVHVDVIESSDVVGGISKSFELFDHIVDLGPHRFYTKDKAILKFWLNLAGDQCHIVNRQTSIFYENKFIKYPLSATDLMFALPLATKAKIFSSFLRRQKYKYVDGDNFSTTMRYRFGDKLYETFFKSYTEKLWGTCDTDLSATIAYQRIGGFGLGKAITHALYRTTGKVNDTFFYPTLGCGQVWENATKEIIKMGGRVFLSHPVTYIEKKKRAFQIQFGNRQNSYDKIISTIPVGRLVKIYQQSPQRLKDAVKELKFRSTILAYAEILGEHLFNEQWIYVNSQHIKTGRITNFSNWGMPNNKKQGSQVVCMEYWCDVGDEMWNMNDSHLGVMAKRDLIQFGVLRSHIARQTIIRLPHTYPIITNSAEKILSDVSQFFRAEKDLQTIGRGGAFKYNNQDHCIEMGIGAAKNVMGQNISTWDVNSEKHYLESSLITEVPPG